MKMTAQMDRDTAARSVDANAPSLYERAVQVESSHQAALTYGDSSMLG